MPSIVWQGREATGKQCQILSTSKEQTTKSNSPLVKKAQPECKRSLQNSCSAPYQYPPAQCLQPPQVTPHRFRPDQGEAKESGGGKRTSPGRSRAWPSHRLLSEIWAGGDRSLPCPLLALPSLLPTQHQQATQWFQRGPQKKMSRIGRPSQPSLWRRGKAGWLARQGKGVLPIERGPIRPLLLAGGIPAVVDC